MSREAKVAPSSSMFTHSLDRWAAISADDIGMSQRVWANPYARISAAMRRSMMFANNMSMSRVVGKDVYEMRDDFTQRRLRMTWMNFAHTMDIHIMLYGFAVFRIDTDKVTPIILEPANLRLHVRLVDGRSEYVVMRRDGFGGMRNEDVPGARVVERSPPTPDGRLTADAISLYKHLIPHDLALELAPVSWLSEARPTVLLRAKEPGPEEAGRLGDTLVHGDANFNVLQVEQRNRERRLGGFAEDEIMRSDAFIKHVLAGTQGSVLSNSTLRAVDSRSMMLTPNILPLPSNTVVDQVVTPSFHTNIEENGMYFAMLVSRMMGVPAFDTGRNGARYTASVAMMMANQTIRACVTELEIVLSDLATEVLMPFFDGHDEAITLRRRAAKKPRASTQSAIEVRIHCSMSFDVLSALFQMGMMTHEQFAEAASEAAHVPRKYFADEHVDPITGVKRVAQSDDRDAKRPRVPPALPPREKTPIEHAEDELKGEDRMFTGQKN